MDLVDSSVWIDYFRNRATPQVERFERLIGTDGFAVADLVIVEVLQGIDTDIEFERTRRRMLTAPVIKIGGEDVAVQAARNYRHLRGLGVTVRKTIDTLIATRCIMDGHRLLYSDRDFDPFVEHLGLRSANP